jgi:hypothetical protein
MSPTGEGAAGGGSLENPFMRAFQREHSMAGKTQTVDQVLKASAYPAMCQWARTERQMNIMAQGQRYGSRANLEHLRSLNRGSKAFLASATLTDGNLIQHTQTRHSNMTSTHAKLALKSTACHRPWYWRESIPAKMARLAKS